MGVLTSRRRFCDEESLITKNNKSRRTRRIRTRVEIKKWFQLHLLVHSDTNATTNPLRAQIQSNVGAKLLAGSTQIGSHLPSQIWYPFFWKFGTRFSPNLVPVFRKFWYPFFPKIGTHFCWSSVGVRCIQRTPNIMPEMGTNFVEKRVPELAKNGYQNWRKTGTIFGEKRVPISTLNGCRIR